MHKHLALTFFLCFSSVVAFAQTGNSKINDHKAQEGSKYSRFGVGLPVDFGSSSADGMGLWGVSDNETLTANLSNPALWGNTIYALGSGGIGIQNYNSEDNFGQAKNSLISINHFQLQLPIFKGKLGVSASFAPVTRQAYEALSDGQEVTQQGSVNDTLSYNTRIDGNGGVSRYEFGIGWRINPHVSIGYAASLVHASIDRSFYTRFDADHPSYRNINSTLQTSGSGFGNRFGAYFSFPNIGEKKQELNIGLALRLPVDIEGKKVQESTFVSGDPDDKNSGIEEKLGRGTIHMPYALTGGITYAPGKKLAISVEGRYENWSSYENELDPSPASVSFTDRTKIGAGLKYYPAVTGSDKFLSHFKYRLGATYDTGHLKIRGENIKTLLFSAGFGIIPPRRVSGFESSVDISLQYGIRGTKSQNLIKDNFWGVKLSVNLGELFFFRPKLK